MLEVVGGRGGFESREVVDALLMGPRKISACPNLNPTNDLRRDSSSGQKLLLKMATCNYTHEYMNAKAQRRVRPSSECV